MANLIVGLQTRKLAVRNRLFFKEPVGLERIEEEYIFKTDDLEFFQQNVLLNGKTQEFVASYVNATIKTYKTMTIERIDFQSLEGNVTSARVTYVGLHSTQTPQPLIFTGPIFDGRYVYHPYYVIVNFISYIGEPGSREEIDVVTKKFSANGGVGGYYLAPSTINGHRVPAPTALMRTPYISSELFSSLPISTSWISCDFFRERCVGSPIGLPIYGKLRYVGFVVLSLNIQRFGLYGNITLEYRDGAGYQIEFGSQQGCGEGAPGPVPTCSTYLYLNGSSLQPNFFSINTSVI